jgi:cytochrome c peroxidase
MLELAVVELADAKTKHDEHEKDYHSIRDGVLELMNGGEMSKLAQEDMDARQKKVQLLAKAIETFQKNVDTAMSTVDDFLDDLDKDSLGLSFKKAFPELGEYFKMRKER